MPQTPPVAKRGSLFPGPRGATLGAMLEPPEPPPPERLEPPPPERPERRVQVVFEVSATSELANALARLQPPVRPPRPARGAIGAALGALIAGGLWYLLMLLRHAELLPCALAVGLLAGIGAVALGGSNAKRNVQVRGPRAPPRRCRRGARP